MPAISQDSSQFQGSNINTINHELWILRLKALLPYLFSSRAIRLANYLIDYLKRKSYGGTSAILFGVDDFHNVWEGMLRDVLKDTEDNWNHRLPTPVFYKGLDPERDEYKRMQMDIIVRQGANLVIVDAKYYDATNTSNSPSWPDIGKQLMYEIAVRDLQSEDGVPHNISSCFVFPASLSKTYNQFTSIKMEYKDDRLQSKLPSIDCYYIPISLVMQAYLDNTKINLSRNVTKL